MAARDFSQAGEIFVDHKGQAHEVLYSILTPLSYKAHLSIQALRHIEKHANAARHQGELPHLLNNPDAILPSQEFPTTQLYYKVIEKNLFVGVIHYKDGIHFVATMHKVRRMKGLRAKTISQENFLYLRGGFKWKKWK